MRATVQDSDGSWLLFEEPLEILCARSIDDVKPVLETASARAENAYAVGFVTYEAAPAFDPALVTHEPSGPLPLAWFGVFDGPSRLDELPAAPVEESGVDSWTPSVTREEYDTALERIREYLREGDTYQVNYSFRLRASFTGDVFGLFRGVYGSQRSSHSAFVETDDFAIASCSPELFFELDGRRILSRPMKGTARRGMTCEQDDAAAAALQASTKDRAENVMIVDMIRNDLGRIAEPGSVQPVSMFDVERYPTVLQMTSTVEAVSDAPVPQVMDAMFPCASVTGAPKVRTMEVIRELESSARGVYTGCVGVIGPGRKARFNVAIRTVAIDKGAGVAEYGVGGGIVWDSVSGSEYEECLAKAAVLTRSVPEFELLETLLWEPGKGYFLLDYHLERLLTSARYFGFDCDRKGIARELADLEETFGDQSQRVRLLAARDGSVRVEHRDAETPESAITAKLAVEPVAASDPFLYHKTTHRGVYENALVGVDGADDVLLFNERDEITEFSTANVVLESGGIKLTPPVACGLLGGTFRQHLIDQGEIRERVISTQDLRGADRIYLINSVRKWVQVDLLP